MRKLAREAVICTLVGMLFVPAALLTYRPYAEKTSIRRQQDYLRQKCDVQASGASAYEIGECTAFRNASAQKDLSAKISGLDAGEYMRGASHGLEVRNLAVRDENVVWAGLAIAPYGFVVGLIAWLLLRLVLFAVKG
jgi:hypothetical protein